MEPTMPNPIHTQNHLSYQISDDPSRIDFQRVFEWLLATYWGGKYTREKVEQAARHSALVIGIYWDQPHHHQQVGYCRVVSDRTRFAWLADVIIDPAHRGKKLGQEMVRFALEHPSLADVHQWMLGTKDAHGVYAKVGFGALSRPELLMQFERQTPWRM